MGLLNTKEVNNFDNTIVEEYIQKMSALEFEVNEQSRENDHLRQRHNALKEYSRILEDEVKNEKEKSSNKNKDIAKYSILCDELKEDCRFKEVENASLMEQNNRLSSELSSRDEEVKKLRHAPGQSQHVEKYDKTTKTSISPLISLHAQLENLKFNVNLAKDSLLKEINTQKSTVKDVQLNELIQEHDKYNQQLKERGVFVGDRNLPSMEQSYRVLCLQNNENKIGVMRELYEIEKDLNMFSEQLNLVVSEVMTRISPVLSKHANKFVSELQGVTFAEDYQNERRIHEDITTRLEKEIAHFKGILASTCNAESKSELDSGKDNSKGWSFDVFDEESP